MDNGYLDNELNIFLETVKEKIPENDSGLQRLLGAYRKVLDEARAEEVRNNIVIGLVGGGRFAYDIDPETDEVFAARYSETSAGRIGQQYLNAMDWLELLHPEDKQRVIDSFYASIRDHSGKTPYDETFRMLGTNGKYRWVHSSAHTIRHTDGTVEMIGISLDETERMEEQQRRLLGAVPISPDILSKAKIGMWAFELDEGAPPRMYGDETMLGLVGLDHQVPPEEMYHAWYDHIDGGSYDLVNEAVAKMASGEHAEVQYPWHHPDGRTIIVRCGGTRNFSYTKGMRIEGTHQDVSATLHYDEEERQRARQIEDELVVSRLRGDSLAYIEDNDPDLDRALEFFGQRILEITECDQVVYRAVDGSRIVFNAPGSEDVPAEVCARCPFARFDTGVFGPEGYVMMNDCSQGYNGVNAPADCPAKSSIMQLIYSGGELVGKLTVHYLRENHVFTENFVNIMKVAAVYLGLYIGRVKAKQDNLARIEAESSNRAKTEFLFNMSHDIRTPMNAILGYTNIGLRHPEDRNIAEDSFRKIRTAGGHLLDLINDILEMSRIESGTLELSEYPSDIRTEVEKVTEMSTTLALAKDIDFACELGRIDNPYVYSDALHGSEIIINLISNAVKYTPEGGRVRYRVSQISGVENGYARYRFEVADNGIGIDAEFQKHLFEAFSREKTSTVSKQEGAGLGLSIVKRIVDMAGGTVSVESEPGKGSTFTVEVPLRVMDEDAIAKFESEIARDLSKPAKDVVLEGRKVLLVEDNEMNREIAEDILTEAGLKVDTAEDGEIAVNTVKEKGTGYYDFILMDIQMPVMNGYEATKAIRSMPGGENVTIIALSANAFEEDRAASKAAGMNEHIAKPIDIKGLFEVITKFI